MGVVVAALEVIEAGFGVIVVTAIPEGVLLGHFAGGGADIAVGVVFVGGDQGVVGHPVDLQDVALQILDEIVPLPLVLCVRAPKTEADDRTVVPVDIPDAVAPFYAVCGLFVNNFADNPSVQDAISGVAPVRICLLNSLPSRSTYGSAAKR